MAEYRVLDLADLPVGAMKAVKAGETDVLLVHEPGGVVAVEAKCPHAGAPLEKGALCDGRIVCPWHLGEFALADGALVNPPPLRPLRTYAVRIVDGAIMTSDVPRGIAPVERVAGSSQRTVALVGAGAAGAMAAGALRRGGFAGRVIAIDPVADEPVDRTNLSKAVLAGKVPPEKTKLDAFAGLDVERRTNRVTKLDARARALTLDDGSTLPFDFAFVATGGVPRRLDVPGAERAFTLRHTDDARAILAKAEGATDAVVIGSSFIGLEVASALVQKGMRVTVVGEETLPFAKQFGDAASRRLVAHHESNGTRFELGAEIVRVDDDAVVFRRDGTETRVPAGVVVMGVGVVPALEMEHDLGLAEHGGGIAVDASLRASPGVYVGGDTANVGGTRIEHWRLAQQHAMVAARAIIGEPAAYDDVPFFWTFHYGKRLGYLGHAKEWDEIVTDGDLEALQFVSYFVKDGRVAAVLSCGRDTQTAALANAMRSKPTLAEARSAVA